MKEQIMAEKNLILKILVGSHLYGTNTETSDKDYLGVFVPEEDYVLGMKKCDQVEIRTNPTNSGKRNTSVDNDTVLYSLPKFIHLASGNNPNIIEIFFAPKKNITYITALGQQLLDSVGLFASKKIKHTFLGYAFSQKQKLMYKNPEGHRKEYIEKFGYDVKFASHLIRLLTEGLEFLVEGRINLPLNNNQFVRDIKLGKHDLNRVLTKADEYEKLVEEAYVRSSLQHTPNLEEINKLQISLLKTFWYDSNKHSKCTITDNRTVTS